jgi:hypothetical protein
VDVTVRTLQIKGVTEATAYHPPFWDRVANSAINYAESGMIDILPY